MWILELPLIFVWYDMIDIGEKPEEYRGIKPYWFKRLIDYNPEIYVNKNPIPTYSKQYRADDYAYRAKKTPATRKENFARGRYTSTPRDAATGQFISKDKQ